MPPVEGNPASTRIPTPPTASAPSPLTPTRCAECAPAQSQAPPASSTLSHDDMYLKLFPEPPEELPHGVAGRVVKRIGFISYALFFIVPLTYVAVFFAIVPLGNPLKHNFHNQWVFLLISNVAVMALFTFLYEATFLSLAEHERPFRVSFIPFLVVLAAQMALLAPILLTHGTFPYLGIASLALFYGSLLFSFLLAYRNLMQKIYTFFRNFIALLALYIPIVVGYIILYRKASNGGDQAGLSIAIAFITFVYRRIMLSRLDPFPLDLAQLLAGFWVQNLFDVVQIVTFPQVNNPVVFVAIWGANAIGNIGFLGFVSDPWIYKIRPTLKNAVLNGIRCRFPLPPIPVPSESFDPLDRGHSPNVGGYRRRQFRFFFFRLLSQMVAMCLYLAISPMLRFGLNKDFTPLSTISSAEYRNSMIFASANLVFVVFVLLLGYRFLYVKHHQTFHEIRELQARDLKSQTRVGLIIAIITHNLVLAIGIILRPYCVFAGYKNCTQ